MLTPSGEQWVEGKYPPSPLGHPMRNGLPALQGVSYSTHRPPLGISTLFESGPLSLLPKCVSPPSAHHEGWLCWEGGGVCFRAPEIAPPPLRHPRRMPSPRGDCMKAEWVSVRCWRRHTPHSVIPKTVKFGGCSPPHLMWAIQHRTQGVPDHSPPPPGGG